MAFIVQIITPTLGRNMLRPYEEVNIYATIRFEKGEYTTRFTFYREFAYNGTIQSGTYPCVIYLSLVMSSKKLLSQA